MSRLALLSWPFQASLRPLSRPIRTLAVAIDPNTPEAGPLVDFGLVVVDNALRYASQQCPAEADGGAEAVALS